MKTSTILLVGAGELGSRHLQSLIKDGLNGAKRNIYVYDPAQQSLDISAKRAAQVSCADTVSLYYSCELNFDVETFDLVVVATNATVRLMVIEAVLSRYQVHYFLLEKVLFQQATEFEQAKELISAHCKGAWVNCGRRMFAVYQQIYQLVLNTTSLQMQVQGYNWGMACNGIHFIDLWSHFCQSLDYTVDHTGLLKNIIESKRKGFYEIEGELRCQATDHRLSLQCQVDESTAPGVVLTIETDNHHIIVNESQREWVVTDKSSNDSQTGMIDFPYQSDVTGKVASHILSDGTCGLTSFSESCRLHLPFLDALTAHFNDNGLVTTNCPIT